MLFQAQYFFSVYMKTLWLVRLWKTQFMSQSGELSVRVFAHTSKDRPTLRSIHQCTWPKRPTAYVLCHLLCPMVPPDKLFYEFTLEATFSPYEINIISVSAVSSWVSSSPKRQLQCTFWQLFKVTVLWSFCMPFFPLPSPIVFIMPSSHISQAQKMFRCTASLVLHLIQTWQPIVHFFFFTNQLPSHGHVIYT